VTTQSKQISKEFDWVVNTATQEKPYKKNCVYILKKKHIKLAVLRNSLKRVLRQFRLDYGKKIVFFKIKIKITKENYAQFVQMLRLKISSL